MKLAKSGLQFISYEVNRLAYSSVPDFAPGPDEVINLSPAFSRHIVDEGGNHYSLTLEITLGNEGLPFTMEASVTGHFAIEGETEPANAMRVNATAILFPYLRSVLSMLSNLAGISPVVLPAVNFAAMMNEAEQAEALSSKE